MCRLFKPHLNCQTTQPHKTSVLYGLSPPFSCLIFAGIMGKRTVLCVHPLFFLFFFHIQSSKLLTSKFFRSFLKFRMLMASQSQILISMVVLSPPKHFLISCNMSTVLNDGCKSFSTCHFIYKRILRGGRNPETLVLVITCNCSLIFL